MSGGGEGAAQRAEILGKSMDPQGRVSAASSRGGRQLSSQQAQDNPALGIAGPEMGKPATYDFCTSPQARRVCPKDQGGSCSAVDGTASLQLPLKNSAHSRMFDGY